MVELFEIPFDGRSIIYAPLKRTAFVGNKTMASRIYEMSCGRPTSLSSAAMREAAGFIERSGILSPDPVACGDRRPATYRPVSVTLFLSNRCNLRCKYCYASAGEHSPLDMSPEIAKQAIDIACDNAVAAGMGSFEVGFHGGGEPTMNWNTLTAAVDHASGKPIRPVITMSSNGCYTEKKLAYVLDHFDGMSLSFDGPPDMQNDQRPRADGKPSHPIVMKTIAAMDKRGFDYGIRMTVTPSSVASLPRMVQFLADNTGVKNVQVEPAFPRGRGKSMPIGGKSADAFIGAFMEAFNIAEDRGIRLFYSGADVDRITGTFCTAPSSALVVLQGGEISTCFEVHNLDHPLAGDFIFGKIADGKVQFDEAKWQIVAGRSIDRLPYCEDCFCKYHCAGDCLSKTFSAGSESRFKPSGRCKINREITKFLILKKIARGKGLWMGYANGGASG